MNMLIGGVMDRDIFGVVFFGADLRDGEVEDILGEEGGADKRGYHRECEDLWGRRR